MIVDTQYCPHCKRPMGANSSDQVTSKRVGDRILYFRGAQVQPDGPAARLKSVNANIIELEISTPTYRGIGIDARYVASCCCFLQELGRGGAREWAEAYQGRPVMPALEAKAKESE